MSVEEPDISKGSNTYVEENPKQLSTTVAEILKENPKRVAVIFSNLDSAINAVIGIRNNITTTLGLPLLAGGNVKNFLQKEDGYMPSMQWFGRSDSGTPTIDIIEVIKR